MAKYKCMFCLKEFAKKTDHTRHINRKIRCDGKTNDEMVEEKIEKVKKELKQEVLEELKQEIILEAAPEELHEDTIIRMVKRMHDIMRSKSSAMVQKAMPDTVKLLLIYFMEPMLEHGCMLEDMMDPVHYTNIPEFTNDKVKYLKFSELISSLVKEVFEKKIYTLWDMLSTHKFTSPIFHKGGFFNSKIEALIPCCNIIWETLNKCKFTQATSDIKGSVYEYFINTYSSGPKNEFGQFFTPRGLIKIIFAINDEVFVDQKLDIRSIYDPCAGTCGFLTEMNKRNPVGPLNIYGTERESDTYAIGLMNLLLNIGSLCSLRNGNSFYDNRPIKFDWIATNPPFGLKDISYDEIISHLDIRSNRGVIKRGGAKKITKKYLTAKEMYPIKTNDGCALFLQQCIAKLNPGGICNIVLPSGLQTSQALKKIRQYLLTKCNVKAVLAVPNGAFDNVGIETMVVFFTNDGNSTEEIIYYETDTNLKEINRLGIVTIEQMEKYDYILNWKMYQNRFSIELKNDNWEIKTIGEICEFASKSKLQSKNGNEEGKYKFYTCAEKHKYIDEYQYEGEWLLINGGGNPNIRIDTNISTSGDVFVLRCVDSCINKYIYYYLKANIDILGNRMYGTGIKHITKDSINSIEIPIPTIEEQRRIIARCEDYDRDINQHVEIINTIEKTKSEYIKSIFE